MFGLPLEELLFIVNVFLSFLGQPGATVTSATADAINFLNFLGGL